MQREMRKTRKMTQRAAGSGRVVNVAPDALVLKFQKQAQTIKAMKEQMKALQAKLAQQQTVLKRTTKEHNRNFKKRSQKRSKEIQKQNTANSTLTKSQHQPAAKSQGTRSAVAAILAMG